MARKKMTYVHLRHTKPQAARGVISLLLGEHANLIRADDPTRWGWQPVQFKGTLYDTLMSLHDQEKIIVWCELPVAAVLRELEKSNAS